MGRHRARKVSPELEPAQPGTQAPAGLGGSLLLWEAGGGRHGEGEPRAPESQAPQELGRDSGLQGGRPRGKLPEWSKHLFNPLQGKNKPNQMSI